MARIFSISYDQALLRTRELLLEQMGHSVASAEGFAQAFKLCNQDSGPFDLMILGHSIPHDITSKSSPSRSLRQNYFVS